MAEVGNCPIFVTENGKVVHISADSYTKKYTKQKNIISKSKEWCNKNKYFIHFCPLLSILRYPDNFSNYPDISKIGIIKNS